MPEPVELNSFRVIGGVLDTDSVDEKARAADRFKYLEQCDLLRRTAEFVAASSAPYAFQEVCAGQLAADNRHRRLRKRLSMGNLMVPHNTAALVSSDISHDADRAALLQLDF